MSDKVRRQRLGKQSLAHSSTRRERAGQASIPKAPSTSKAQHELKHEHKQVDEAQHDPKHEPQHMDEVEEAAEIEQHDIEEEAEPEPPPPPRKRNPRTTRGRNPPPVETPPVTITCEQHGSVVAKRNRLPL
ncbi:unnamed protein product [Trifolium pratense]|uniref:Uncharacterized protein n=1 Tax=Trifolium pratense TaxID=57577 RepID=A0ACB0LHF7_TRIPR|nr:unnamed protein product [Trifolium pratense]